MMLPMRSGSGDYAQDDERNAQDKGIRRMTEGESRGMTQQWTRDVEGRSTARRERAGARTTLILFASFTRFMGSTAPKPQDTNENLICLSFASYLLPPVK